MLEEVLRSNTTEELISFVRAVPANNKVIYELDYWESEYVDVSYTIIIQ